jgi:hypothetical protein
MRDDHQPLEELASLLAIGGCLVYSLFNQPGGNLNPPMNLRPFRSRRADIETEEATSISLQKKGN